MQNKKIAREEGDEYTSDRASVSKATKGQRSGEAGLRYRYNSTAYVYSGAAAKVERLNQRLKASNVRINPYPPPHHFQQARLITPMPPLRIYPIPKRTHSLLHPSPHKTTQCHQFATQDPNVIILALVPVSMSVRHRTGACRPS